MMKSNTSLFLKLLLFLYPSLACPAVDFQTCSLLTAAEIKEIAGVTVGEGTQDMMGELFQCSWAAEEENAASPMISFQKTGADEKTICNQRYELDKKNQRYKSDITGLGEKAWWTFHKQADFFIGGVNICGPSGILRVSLWGPGEEEKMKKMAEGLARKAYGRLK